MRAFAVAVATPEGPAWAEEVESLVLPGVGGFFGIWAGHAPLIAGLAAGVLKAERGGRARYFAVGDGMVEAGGNRVAILTEAAIPAADAVDAAFKVEELRKERTRPPLVVERFVEG